MTTLTTLRAGLGAGPRTVTETWHGPGRRDGTIAPVPASANAAHPTGARTAFEHWYFDALLDDGHIIVGMLQSRELVARKPGVELHVYSPDGARREIIARYSDADIDVATDRCRVRIGANTASAEFPEDGGPPVHHLHMAEEDIVFDLRYDGELPSWMPGDGRTSYRRGGRDTGEFFAWVVGAPRARVSGTVRLGGKTLAARGIGYHDHNWGVADMKRVIDRWYWGRLYTDDYTLVYANVLTQKAYGAHWATPLMLGRDGTVILSSGEVRLETGPERFHPVAGRTYPESLRMTVPGQVDLLLEVQDIVHAHDFLADVPIVRAGPVKALARTALGRPGYFRFRSRYTLTVNEGGRDEVRTGTTLHEMVALK